MGWPGIAFATVEEELGFLRAHAQVTRIVDALLEDCLEQGLGLDAALDAFLSYCGRLLGASDGFIEVRGTGEPVLTRRLGWRWLDPTRFAEEGVHPVGDAMVLLKHLTLGSLRLGSFGLRVDRLSRREAATAMVLVDAMGEQLDSVLLAFVAIADGAGPAQRLDELAANDRFRPRMRIGRYELQVPLGAGGMAQVFIARQLGADGVGRLVALKRILPHLVEERDVIDSFLDEAQIGMRLSHPNLPSTYDFGRGPGGYFLAMELVRGTSLQALLKNQGSLPPAMAVEILVQGLRGLHAAHGLRDEEGAPLRLVHRDLSPQNLMIGFDGVVKVLDFGIASIRRQRNHTEAGQTKGKAHYMSPEQALGYRLDLRSDIFAAGVVLYQMLTGHCPFAGDNELAIMEAVVSHELARPAKVPRSLWPALSRALSKDCAERWPDALGFAGALVKAVRPAGEAELGSLMRTAMPEAHRAFLEWDRGAVESGDARTAGTVRAR